MEKPIGVEPSLRTKWPDVAIISVSAASTSRKQTDIEAFEMARW